MPSRSNSQSLSFPHTLRDLSTNSFLAKRRSTTQIILLPRNDWTSAQTFVSDGSGPALSTVTDPDGSFTNLGFDVHKYLDSGTHIECVDSYISTAFAPLAQWLRCNGRQALLVR